MTDPAVIKRWQVRLASSSSLALPTDYPRPTPARLVEAIQEYPLSKDVLSSLSTLAQQHPNSSTSTLILTAFLVLLHRYTPDPSVAVCTSATSDPALTALLLVDMSNEQQVFGTIVDEVEKKFKEAKDDPVDVDALVALRSDGEGPLYRVRYIVHDDMQRVANGEQPTFTRSTSLTTDLSLHYTPVTQSLAISYNALLFSLPRITHLLASLSALLEHASGNLSTPTAVIPLRTPEQAKVLPDPKADLDWCGFKGAITDIFSANAARHPEKPCVVQSLPSADNTTSLSSGASTERQTFTYAQIDAASNVLAHALLQNGLERGEVVMVYAARSVELVVCVMGVLKAGGVFSVIGKSWFTFCYVGIPLILRLRSRSRVSPFPSNSIPPSINPTRTPDHQLGWNFTAHCSIIYHIIPLPPTPCSLY
jgi:L-aminoadipate-semialdehyde dehydrogenase